MPADDRLEALFRRWQGARREGKPLTVEELCGDCPDLAAPLRERIAAEFSTDVPPVTVVERSERRPPTVFEPPEGARPTLVETRGQAPGTAPTFLDLAPGVEPVAGYRLVALLGRGSFGQVWKAVGPGGFPVAMKFVHLDEEAPSAELRALEVMKEIRHANLLALFGAWQLSDMLVVAMELADDSLLDRCNRYRAQGQVGIPREELLEAMADAAKGIDFLNEPRHVFGGAEPVGIQHRDIKPQNLLRVGSSVKVADFGLAKILERTAGSNSGSMTAAYAAPECFKGRTSNRSDQYSLAVSYCQLRGGRLPFAGSNVGEIMIGHVSRPPDLSMLPAEEQPAVRRALAKEPEARWPSCRAFVEALTGALDGSEVYELVEGREPTRAPESPLLSTEAEVPGADSLPTLVPLPTPASPADWQAAPGAEARRRRGVWVWVLALAGLAALAGGLTLGILYALLPRPEEVAETGGEHVPRTKPVALTRSEPTKPTPPPKKTGPAPDPEKIKREQAAAKAKQGAGALAAKDWDGAIKLFTDAITLDPDNATYYYQRGKAYHEAKQYRKAVDDLTDAIKRDDRYAAAYAQRGRAYGELKKYDLALDDLKTAVRLDPKDVAALVSRGTAYANLKDYRRALEDLDEALSREPRSALALYNRGVVYYKQEKFSKAIDDFTAVLDIDPKHARAYASRGRAHVQLKEFEDALFDYDKALESDPKYVWAWNARGQLYYHHYRDYDRAIQDYNEAIRLDNRYAVAYANRADAYDKLKKRDLAEEDRRTAKELAEKMPAELMP